MANLYEDLALWADTNLEPGTSSRIVCPKCRGGTTEEKCMAVTLRDDLSLYWRCFRASCEWSGVRSRHGPLRAIGKPTLTPKAPKPYLGHLEALGPRHKEYFEGVYGIREPMLNTTRWAPVEGRFAHSILSPDDALRGLVLRAYPSFPPCQGREPKALTFKEITDEPWIGWYGDGEGWVVVVEDNLSALKVAQTGKAIAVSLNGTFLSLEMAEEISEWGQKHVLALDKGTLPLMLKYKARYDSLFLEPLTIWNLKKDLKYVDEELIIKALSGEITDFGKAASSGRDGQQAKL